MESTVFTAKLENLYEMLSWIGSYCEKVGFSASAIKKIELASEEALMNIINHAYKQKLGDIYLDITTSNKQVKIIIKDTGASFNPLLQAKKPNVLAPLEERAVGGLGIHMIKEYMDEVQYVRKEPYNILTLVKNIH